MDIYDVMADIICRLRELSFEAEKLKVLSQDDVQQIDRSFDIITKLGEDVMPVDSLREWLKDEKRDGFELLFILQKLDEAAHRQFKDMLRQNTFEDCIECNGLNSDASIRKTSIIILPRMQCVWSGKSMESNHIWDINSSLVHSFFVNMKDGKIQNGYHIRNYILNPRLYNFSLDGNSNTYLRAGLSPISNDVRLSLLFGEREEGGRKLQVFSVEPLGCETQRQIVENMKKAIEKAEQEKVQVLVFPEMLGSEQMKEKIEDFLHEYIPENIQMIILPSIWNKNKGEQGSNISYVMNYNGDVWFGQPKLQRFIYEENHKSYIENIPKGKEINLIHAEGIGTAAVLICRGELDTDIRFMLQKELNVKLIVCPSWTRGHTEFERSMLTGSELNSNVIWCNTCSAVEGEFEKRIIGIITSFGKNHKFSTNNLETNSFPKKNCNLVCKNGCVFAANIYGKDYDEMEG